MGQMRAMRSSPWRPASMWQGLPWSSQCTALHVTCVRRAPMRMPYKLAKLAAPRLAKDVRLPPAPSPLPGVRAHTAPGRQAWPKSRPGTCVTAGTRSPAVQCEMCAVAAGRALRSQGTAARDEACCLPPAAGARQATGGPLQLPRTQSHTHLGKLVVHQRCQLRSGPREPLVDLRPATEALVSEAWCVWPCPPPARRQQPPATASCLPPPPHLRLRLGRGPKQLAGLRALASQVARDGGQADQAPQRHRAAAAAARGARSWLRLRDAAVRRDKARRLQRGVAGSHAGTVTSTGKGAAARGRGGVLACGG